MPALGDAAVFPFPPDGGTPVRVARTWLTDVNVADDGSETRIATRDYPARRMAYTAVFADARDAGDFRALWYAAAQPLRFLVPLWREQSQPTAIAGSTITCDTSDRRFVAGERAILWQEYGDEILWEVVEIEAVDDESVTTVDPVEETFTIGAVYCFPLMAAWLEPPTIELRGYIEILPLVFHEELPKIAGIDPDVEGEVTPEVESVVVHLVHGNNPYPPTFAVYVVRATDVDGMPITDPDALWALSPPDALVTLTPSIDRQSARIDVAADHAPAIPAVQCTVGGVTGVTS